jgi:hypothetical protein
LAIRKDWCEALKKVENTMEVAAVGESDTSNIGCQTMMAKNGTGGDIITAFVIMSGKQLSASLS